MPLIAGGAVAGGIALAIIVIVIVLMFRRYAKNGKFCNHLFLVHHYLDGCKKRLYRKMS